MSWPYALFGFLFGTGVNWLADQLPRRRGLALPRCPACGGPRRLAAWSGLTAWIAGQRRCPYCGEGRGLRAAVVELGLALAWAGFFAGKSPPQAWLAGVVLGIYTLITVIDLEHRLILHVVSLPSAAGLALVGILDPTRGAAKTLIGGAAGAAIVGAMYLGGIAFSKVLARVRRQQLEEVAFGFGDVTLALLVGLTVGWPGVVAAILVAVFSAGAYALVYLAANLVRGRYVAFTPIPYGPFMVLGGLAVYFGWISTLAGSGGGG